MDYWPEIAELKGRTFKTLDQKKPFDVVAITDQTVIIKPHASSKERFIDRQEIEGAFNHLMRQGQISRTEIQAKFSPRNPVYVATLLAALPQVECSVRPIELRVKADNAWSHGCNLRF